MEENRAGSAAGEARGVPCQDVDDLIFTGESCHVSER